MKNCILILILLSTLNMRAQQGFQTIIESSYDNYVSDIFVYNDKYLVLGGIEYSNNTKYGCIYKINEYGVVEDSIILNDLSLNSTASRAYLLQNGDIRVFCTREKENIPGCYLLHFLDIDENLNLMNERFYDLGTGRYWGHINTFLNDDNTIFLASTVDGYPPNTGPQYFDKLLMQITQEGDIIIDSVYNHSSLEIVFDFVKYPNSENSILYCMKSFENGDFLRQINVLDANFNLIQNYYIEDYSAQASLRSITDEQFIVCNKSSIDKSTEEYWYTSASTYNLQFERTNQILLGSTDSASYPAMNNSIAIIDNEHIFLGSTFNMQSSNFPEANSFFRIDHINSNLDIHWQKYYGGDAYYFLEDISATQDGGCILAGTRYEHGNNGPFERDIFVLKVDQNGLITSTSESQSIPIKNAIVLPNPGKEYLQLHTGEYPTVFRLFNISGQQVLEEQISNETSRINTVELKQGTYIWQVLKDGDIIEDGKWVRE